MVRRWTWVGMVMLAGGIFLLQSGCAEQKPKPSGNTSVDPAMKAKPGVPAVTPDKSGDTAKTSTPEEKPAPTDDETPPKTPGDAGSTTGGGTELPANPQ